MLNTNLYNQIIDSVHDHAPATNPRSFYHQKDARPRVFQYTHPYQRLGNIYSAYDKERKEMVALKVEKADKSKKVLLFEHQVLMSLQGTTMDTHMSRLTQCLSRVRFCAQCSAKRTKLNRDDAAGYGKAYICRQKFGCVQETERKGFHSFAGTPVACIHAVSKRGVDTNVGCNRKSAQQQIHSSRRETF